MNWSGCRGTVRPFAADGAHVLAILTGLLSPFSSGLALIHDTLLSV